MPTGGLNTFGLHQFDYKDSFFGGKAELSQAVGYGIVIGYGAFFAVLTSLMTCFDRRFGGVKNNSEEFNTAGRQVKVGLVAVDVVSRWTWVATVLIAGNYAFVDGFSGVFWSATAPVVQVFLFGIVTLQLKKRAPKAHTVIELVYLRWGKIASFVFLYLCILTNCVVSVLLFIGAANVITAITGMNIYAALVLLPFGVVIYTAGGGLKATFLSSYVHTVIIFAALNVFVYVVYASNKEPVGSIGKVWENLNIMSNVVPVVDNRHGSYLTMFSKNGLQFGVYSLFSAFGGLIADQAYWQGAIAATPKAAFHGYILGGLLWVPIPFIFALALGLGAVALDLPISAGEFNAGLISVAAAQFLMGKAGVILVLTIVFMAVTSSGSAELLAMSSLFTYDIYKRHLHPKATGKQMLLVSQCAVVVAGLCMAGLSCGCVAVGINVNFVFFVVGLLISSAVPPLTCMVTWSKMPANAAIAGALGGQALSITTWLVHTHLEYGRLTVSDTLQRLSPTLDGTMVALISSTVICVFWTLIAPEKGDGFDWWQSIETLDEVKVPEAEKDDLVEQHVIFNKYSLTAIALTVFLVIIWPLLTLPEATFSKKYFRFWVVIMTMWTVVSTLIATFLPIVEARHGLLKILRRFLGMNSKNENVPT